MKLVGILLLFLGSILCSSHALAVKTPKDHLVIAWDVAPRTLDPRFTVDAKSHYLSDLVNCSLINFNSKGEIIFQLAQNIRWLDNKTLDITLHNGVYFSHGRRVTAVDVKATYDFFKQDSLKKPSPLAATFKRINVIEVKSPTHLLFKLAEPDVSFMQNLMIGILPADLAQKEMIENPSQLIGCGPYKIRHRRVNRLELEQNPYFAKSSIGTPVKTPFIDILIVKDELTRFSKLRKGEIDLLQDSMSRDRVKEVAARYPQLKVMRRTGLNVTYLGFNMRDRILSRLPVRQAIAHGINCDEIIKYIFHGMAIPAVTILPPAHPFLNPNLQPLKYDAAYANKLLDGAGFSKRDAQGYRVGLALKYKTTTDTTRITIAKAIAAQLQKIGVKVQVEVAEWGKFKKDVEEGKAQMWSLSWVGFKDPDIYRYAFASDSVPPNGGNRGWYSNKALDQLLAQAKIEADVNKRKSFYYRVQEIVAKDLPYVFLWHEELFAVMKKSVQGYELYADGRMSALAKAYKTD